MSFIDRMDAFTNGISELVDRAEAEKQYLAAERRSMTITERAELHDLIEHDRWLESVCSRCGEPLQEDGSCQLCQSEAADERRNDL